MIATPKADAGGADQVRAQRFEIRTPIRYRSNGDSRWHQGTIQNISSSGVLFQCEHALGPDTLIEMSWTVPVGALGGGGAEVRCRGRVVRAVSESGDQTALAASISNYRLTRP